jgi:TolB-like protein
MRSRSIVTLLALSAAGIALGGLAAPLRAQDTRPGIAVLPFNNGGSYGQGKEDFEALQRGMAGILISELSATPSARIVEREQIQKVIDEQNLAHDGRVDEATGVKIGKLVGARYYVLGNFIDFYGDFRVDVRLVNVQTGEIVKTESARMQRDHLFDIIKSVAAALLKDIPNLPPLPKQTSDQRMSRQVPTEALTFYSRALLYHDRGDHTHAREMFQKAVDTFPDFTEAKEGLQREPTS